MRSVTGRQWKVVDIGQVAGLLHATGAGICAACTASVLTAELGKAQSNLTSAFALDYGFAALRAMGIGGAPSPVSPSWSPTSVVVSGITNSTIPSFAL